MAKFAFVSTMSGNAWGGSEELWARSALHLRKLGYEVTSSTDWWPKPATKLIDLRLAGVDVTFRTAIPRQTLGRAWRKLKRHLGWHRDEEIIWLNRVEPDFVLISQGGNLDGIHWMLACDRLSIPYAAIVHCNCEFWWPAAEMQPIAASAYRRARRVFCVSRHNLRLLEEQIGEDLPNAKIVWNPMNVGLGPAPSWPAKTPLCRLACVARLDAFAKGQDLLIRVMAEQQWRNRPVVLSFYGRGPWESQLRAQVSRLGIEERVRFAGHVSDIRALWADNELLVLPSRLEGLPLALMEAMYCARPAVVTDVGGSAEICLDGETGFVATAPRQSLFSNALERAWQEQNRWPAMGIAARSRIEELVQRDPVEAFCTELEDCMGQPGVALSKRRTE